MASGKKVSKMKRGIRNTRMKKEGAKKKQRKMRKLAKTPNLIVIK